jgi:hypothetical protein
MKDEKEAEIVHIHREDRMNLQPQISLENQKSETNKQKESI